MNKLVAVLAFVGLGLLVAGKAQEATWVFYALFGLIPFAAVRDIKKAVPTNAELNYDDSKYFKPDGQYGSLRWDESIQELRWFTKEDLVRFVDPDTKEVHMLWPDEVEEMERDIRTRRAEEWYGLYECSNEWFAYCDDKVEPGSPKWMGMFPEWKDTRTPVGG